MDLNFILWWTSMLQDMKVWISQKCDLQSFVFQQVPIWQGLLAIQLGGFEYSFRCLKWFTGNCRESCDRIFFLKLRSLKVWLLVTWLKFLLLEGGGNQINAPFPKLRKWTIFNVKTLPFFTFSFKIRMKHKFSQSINQV